jgi:hypothetical protein
MRSDTSNLPGIGRARDATDADGGVSGGAFCRMLMTASPRLGWVVRNGLRVFGTQTQSELLRTVTTCTHDRVADQIRAPA